MTVLSSLCFKFLNKTILQLGIFNDISGYHFKQVEVLIIWDCFKIVKRSINKIHDIYVLFLNIEPQCMHLFHNVISQQNSLIFVFGLSQVF